MNLSRLQRWHTAFLAFCVLAIFTLGASSEAFAQERTVTGKITDEKGEVLPGVNVLVQGSTRGTASDAKGMYSISADGNATLIFSFIGYKRQEVGVNGRSKIDLSLETDASALEEVVVVGYGTQKKTTLTGSVAQVDGKELVKSPQPNLTNSLAGRTPGLIANNRSGEPGNDGSTLLIRGRSTTGDASPLIVVDGIANRQGGFERIDPNDVESISILKDASAAIYGAQAANGVILVTTKRGKSGKPTISYSFNQGFQTPTRVPEMADAPTYATLLNEMRFYQNPTNPQYAYTDAQIQKMRDGSDPLNFANTNWLKSLMKPISLQNQHSLSVSGGTDAVKYYVSGGSLFQDGFYRTSATNYKQQFVRSNIDAQVTKSLKIGVDLNVRLENRNFPSESESAGTIFRFAMRAAPFLPDYYPNGLPGPAIEQGRNPVVISTNEVGYRNDKRTILNGTVRLRQDLGMILPGLSVDGFFAYDKEFRNIKNFAKPWTIYNYNNQTQTYDPTNGGPGKPTLVQSLRDDQTLTANIRLAYDKTFGLHSLNTFVAYEQSTFTRSQFSAQRINFLSPAVDQLFAGDTKDAQANGSGFESARQNYFGRVGYGYGQKYLAEVQFRYDGSFNFAKDKRFGFFPAVSVGWRLSEENFFKEIAPVFNNLKLRASYGLMGNDRLEDPDKNPIQFQFLTTYGFQDAGYTLGATPGLVKGVFASATPNPNATWEVLKSSNIGLDGSMWKGKVTFELNYFIQNRSNILAKRSLSVPSYTGLVLPFENIGKVSNRGFEMQAAYNNNAGDFVYSFGGNFSFAKNNVEFLDEAPGLEPWQTVTNKPINSPLLWQADGIFQNQAQIDAYPHVAGTQPGDIKLIDYNGDGKIDEKDQFRFPANSTPQILYGITGSASWKSFDVSVLFQGQARATQFVLLESGSTGNFFANDVAKRWSPTNTTGTWPRVADKMYTSLSGNAYPNSFWLRDVWFFRLKNVELGYTLPNALLQKVKMAGARIYFNGFNLFTIDKNKNIDPEGDNNSGIFYPQQRTFNIGVNVKF